MNRWWWYGAVPCSFLFLAIEEASAARCWIVSSSPMVVACAPDEPMHPDYFGSLPAGSTLASGPEGSGPEQSPGDNTPPPEPNDTAFLDLCPNGGKPHFTTEDTYHRCRWDDMSSKLYSCLTPWGAGVATANVYAAYANSWRSQMLRMIDLVPDLFRNRPDLEAKFIQKYFVNWAEYRNRNATNWGFAGAAAVMVIQEWMDSVTPQKCPGAEWMTRNYECRRTDGTVLSTGILKTQYKGVLEALSGKSYEDEQFCGISVPRCMQVKDNGQIPAWDTIPPVGPYYPPTLASNDPTMSSMACVMPPVPDPVPTPTPTYTPDPEPTYGPNPDGTWNPIDP